MTGRRPSPEQLLEEALATFAHVDLSWLDPPPRDDGWELPADTIRFVTRLVGLMGPTHVVEFGSGLSTRVLAHVCGTLPEPPWLTSIENDPAVAQRVDAGLGPMDTRTVVHVAPLVVRRCLGRLAPVYHVDPKAFACPLPADLVLVDGPNATLGGRLGSLYQALALGCPGTIVVLDDARREDEQNAVRQLVDRVGSAVEAQYHEDFTKGLAVLILREVGAVPDIDSLLELT